MIILFYNLGECITRAFTESWLHQSSQVIQTGKSSVAFPVSTLAVLPLSLPVLDCLLALKGNSLDERMASNVLWWWEQTRRPGTLSLGVKFRTRTGFFLQERKRLFLLASPALLTATWEFGWKGNLDGVCAPTKHFENQNNLWLNMLPIRDRVRVRQLPQPWHWVNLLQEVKLHSSLHGTRHSLTGTGISPAHLKQSVTSAGESSAPTHITSENMTEKEKILVVPFKIWYNSEMSI